MADFFEAHGYNLLTASSDVDGDAITVRKIGTSVGTLAVPGSFPATYSLAVGSLVVLNAAGDFKLTLANNTGNPADGATAAAGTIYFTVIDAHGLESTTHATCTVNLTGSTGNPTPPLVTTGLVERWAGDAGKALSGATITSWTGQTAGLVLTPVGSPQSIAVTGGIATTAVSIGDGAGFTGTPTGFPTGAVARTVQMVWRLTGTAWFGGFGWGSQVSNQAFTLSATDAGEIQLDYLNNRIATGLTVQNEWMVVTATYDGTTIKVYIGDVLAASVAVALATGSTLINVCRSFSGITTHADIGDVLVYGRELTAAERAQNVTHLNARYVGSLAVSDPSAPTGSALAATSFTANITTNDPYCLVAWAARTSSTTMTEAEILAGTGAIAFGVALVNGAGSVSPNITGGAASTGYYVNVIKYGIKGGKSAVVKSAVITTTATPAVAPVLSAASLLATGQTTLAGSVTTDTGNGTLKYGLMPIGATTPNLTQLEAGTDGDGAPLIGGLRSQAVNAAGAQSVLFTGATPGTGYEVAWGQRNGSNQASNVVSATDTTDAATVTTGLTPDATATTAVGLYAILDNWEANWNTTTPSGKTNADVRVAQLTAPYTGGMTFNNDFSAYPGVIIRGIGPYTDNPTYPYYPLCGSHVSGTITFSGAKNMRLYGITCTKVAITGASSNIRTERTSAHSRWSATRSSPNVAGPGIAIAGGTACTVADCHVGGFRALGIDVAAGCHDALIEGNYVEQFADDLFKCRVVSGGTLDRPIFRRNWGGRDNLSPAGAHSDYLQNQDGTVNDMLFYGNFAYEGAMLAAIEINGFCFQSTLNVGTRTICEQNLYFGRGGNSFSAAPTGVNDICRYNTGIYSEVGAHGSVQPGNLSSPRVVGAWSVNEFNIVCRTNTGAADTSGTGGVVLTIGDVFGSSIVANTSQYPTYLDGFPGELTYINACKPKLGSPAHWDYTGQKVGAYERAREIWVLGMHPGNVGWPVAGRFHAEYDPLNTLGSSWTGTYDDDGNNVTPAPTMVTITDPSLTVYDSDPHGADAAQITFTGTHDQDGSTLQIRVYDPSDDSDVVAWTDFTAGAGGNWSKSLDVPRGWNACRAQVRAKHDTGVIASQTTSFYSGYIVGIMGQSLAERPLYISPSSASLTPPAKTLWLLANNQNGSVNAGQIEVTSSSILGLRRMAAAVGAHSDAPICIVDLAASGTSFGSLVNANESTTQPERSWFASFEDPVAYVQARGSDLSVVLWHWFTSDAAVQTEAERFLMPGLAKQALNSLNDTADASGLVAYTSGAVNVVPARAYTPVHFLWDLNGTGQGLFDETRTKFTVLFGASFFNPSGTSGTWGAAEIQKGKFAQAQRDMTDGVGVGQFSLASVAGWTGHTSFGGHMAQPEGTHVSDDTGEEDGEALAAVYLGIAACRAVGALNPLEPRIIGVTDAGTHWDVEIDLPHGGNLSTALIEHGAGAYAGSFEATNWQTPSALDEGDIAELHDVQGFAVWTGSNANWTAFTAVIQDAGTGTAPNRSGVIRVTPSGGTSGKTLSFGYGSWVNMTSAANAKAARVHTHLPIETRTHVSGAGYGFPVRRQSGNTSIVAET